MNNNIILTIDFDIIMSPSIEMYNILIGENRDDIDKGYRSVQELIDQNPFSFVNYNADLAIYQKLTSIIKQVTNKISKENIFFEEYHDSIFVNHQDIFPIDTIINIDHHHDFGYKGDNIIKINLANWAQYLLNNNLINNYIWIHDWHSKLTSKYHPLEKIDKQIIFDFNINDYLKDIQYLCLCRSGFWVPERYFPLFDLWKELFA